MTNVWLQPMTASEVMTRTVFTVDPETPTRAVAKLLVDKGISGVPVVDATGAAIGMVSEGDLVRWNIGKRARVWWLELLAEGEDVAKEFIDHLKAVDRPVREIMKAPVVAIAEDTPVQVIAETLEAHRVKRVPVLHDGRIVGIVSRADLVRALARTPPA